MLDLATVTPPAPSTLIAIEIGGVRLALTRTARPGGSPSRPFAWGTLAGLGAATLALAGASATSQPPVSRPVLSQLVPDIQPRRLTKLHPHPTPGRSRKPVASTAEGPFDAEDASHVARALATGALEEWEGADGQRRFLTAGPARVADGRTCRAMALLIRLADGGSHVRSAERCTTAPVSDVPAEPIVSVENASDGADE